MNLLIAADMEGITGVCHWDHVESSKPDYERFRRLMTADINAAISGAAAAGVNEIIVADGHDSGHNILLEELNPSARLNSGNDAPFAMVQGVDGKIDAAFLIGYHARMGTLHAVLDHTWSGVRIADVWLNGQLVGELGINSAVLGAYGIPVLMVSGDQALAAEAREWIPGIETAVVKRGTSRNSAECLPPAVSQALIREAAERAVRRFKTGEGPQPVRMETPVTLTVAFQNSAYADGAAMTPGAVRLDGRRIEMRTDNMTDAYFAFQTLADMSRR